MDYPSANEKLKSKRSQLRNVCSIKLEQHIKKGKFHVSERISRLVDQGSWLEYGEFARSGEPGFEDKTPRDGVMTGLAKIYGHTVAIIGDDITVLGGSQSFVSVRKVDRVVEIATKNNFPIISLSEGGGGRIPDFLGVGFTRFLGLSPVQSLNGLADCEKRNLFICAVFGYSYGDPAFRAAMADITVMMEDSAMGVSGPSLVEAALSEKITDRELAGPDMHKKETGLVDIVANSEEACLGVIKKIIDILDTPRELSDPPERLVPALQSIVPSNKRKSYDMRKVIQEICDSGEWLELKANFGKGVTVGLGRMGGQAIGVIANQPLFLGGSIDAKGLQKIASFVRMATRLRLPLLVIQDVPGFLIGSRVEKDGMLKEIGNQTNALANIRVPMVTLVIRKAYGVAYYFMGTGASGADFVMAWPNAEITLMSPEMGAAILTKNIDPAKRKDIKEELASKLMRKSSVWDSAYEGWLDAIIQPDETRKAICHAFAFLADKTLGPFVR